jgi:hypothetical protein
MRRPHILIVVGSALVWAACAPTARAQVPPPPPPAVGLQVFAVPSAYPSEWQTTHCLALMNVVNYEPQEIECRFRVNISVNGSLATTIEARRFPPGYSLWTTPQIARWERLRFTGDVATSIERTGHLPEGAAIMGVYLESVVNAVTRRPLPSTSAVQNFTVSIPPPPSLQMPGDRSEVTVPLPVFGWTPVFLQTGSQASYRFQFVRVFQGQTPLQAVELNRPEVDTTVTSATLSYPSSAPRLQNGWRYAWRVQGVFSSPVTILSTRNGGRQYAQVGTNSGLSQVFSFAWRAPGAPRMAPAPMATALGDADLDPEGRAGILGAARVQPEASPTGRGVSFDTARPRAVSAMGRSRPIVPAEASATTASAAPTWWSKVLEPEVRAVFPVDRNAPPPPGAPSVPTPGAPASGDSTQVADAVMASTAAPSGGFIGGVSGAPGLVETEARPGWLRLVGNVSAAGEVYGHEGEGPAGLPGRNGQITAGLTLSMLDGKVNVPFDALVSGHELTVRQSMNQLGFNPRWEWGNLLAGHFHPQYSTLTLYDATVMGGGGEITRGRWHAGGVSGRIRKAFGRDSLSGFEGQFARNVNAGRFGTNNLLFKTSLEVTVMEARDDVGSLPATDSLLRATPSANTVLSVKSRRVMMDSTVAVQVEGAWSRSRRDVRAAASQIFGRAMTLQVARETPRTGVGARFDYLGAGFVTLGNSSLASDRIEAQLIGRRAFFDGLVDVGANAGVRQDDVGHTLGARTRHNVVGTRASLRPPKGFGGDVEIQLAQGNADPSGTRPELDDRTQGVTFSPRYMWGNDARVHAVSASVTHQKTNYSGAGAVNVSDIDNTSVVGTYQGPLTPNVSFVLSGNYFHSDLGTLVTETSSAGPGLNVSLFGGRLQSLIQVQMTQSRLGNNGIDREVTPSLEARCTVAGRHSIALRAGYRHYRASNPLGTDFDDRQATLEYSAGL